MDELLELSAAAAVAEMRNGELTAEDYADASLRARLKPNVMPRHLAQLDMSYMV